MIQKVLSFVKSGQFWAGFAVGVVAATAFSKLRKPAKIIASKIPGNDTAAA
jgi:hypothetical protein